MAVELNQSEEMSFSMGEKRSLSVSDFHYPVSSEDLTASESASIFDSHLNDDKESKVKPELKQLSKDEKKLHVDWPDNVKRYAGVKIDQCGHFNTPFLPRMVDAYLILSLLGKRPGNFDELFNKTKALSPDGEDPVSNNPRNGVSLSTKPSQSNYGIIISGYDKDYESDLKRDRHIAAGVFGKMGIPDNATHCRKLVYPSEEDVKKQFESFKGKTGDRLVIYYGGHGTTYLSSLGEKRVIEHYKDKGYSQEDAVAKLAEIKAKWNSEKSKDNKVFLKFCSDIGLTKDPRNFEGYLALGSKRGDKWVAKKHGNKWVTETQLKKWAKDNLSGFKEVVFVFDCCRSGSMIAGNGKSARNSV